MAINFNNLWPYSEIEKVTVDGQEMVRIPKIYVRNTKLPDGAKYAGKWQYSIAKEKLSDEWHVHPAFISGGIECKALDLSCYEASPDAKDSRKPASVATSKFWLYSKCNEAVEISTRRNVDGGSSEQTGWHCWDIYCQSLLARLMLIELGTTAFAFPENGAPDYVYRGIHQPAGNPQNPTWLPGIENIDDKICIYSSYGNNSLVNTGIAAPANGWPVEFLHDVTSSYDMGDVFIASKTSDVENDGSCSDWQHLARNGVQETAFFTGYRGSETLVPVNGHGMFSLSQQTCGTRTNYGSPSAQYANMEGHGGPATGALHFRLARFVM